MSKKQIPTNKQNKIKILLVDREIKKLQEQYMRDTKRKDFIKTPETLNLMAKEDQRPMSVKEFEAVY